MCATVFGASLGYVSNANVPFDVSTTMTGPAPTWADAIVGVVANTADRTQANALKPSLRGTDGFSNRPAKRGLGQIVRRTVEKLGSPVTVPTLEDV